MSGMKDLFQSDDWKKEKHVPVIECPDKVTKDRVFEVKLTLGKEVAHPNTTAHHIRWISLYFLPDGAKFPYHVGQFEFTAHGESVDGADKGPVYTNHSVTATMMVGSPGELIAASYCNIHGLWENSKKLSL
jgi:superoxide reductase